METCVNVLMAYGGLHVKIAKGRSKYKVEIKKKKLHIFILVSAGMINEMSDIIFHEVLIFQIQIRRHFEPTCNSFVANSRQFVQFCTNMAGERSSSEPPQEDSKGLRSAEQLCLRSLTNDDN